MHKNSLSLGKGFTLIEMVMVLVIIGLLAAIVMPQFTSQLDEAREAQTRANLENLRSAVAIYVKRYGVNPLTLNDLAGATPTILPSIPLDGWGISFTYTMSTGGVSCNTISNPKCLSMW